MECTPSETPCISREHRLSKKERLSCVSAIDRLVAQGRYIAAGPVRCCYLSAGGDGKDGTTRNRIMVSVPKRLFKRAVKRNLLKRRLREAYRLQKEILTANGTDMMFVYTSREISEFRTIAASVRKILTVIETRMENEGRYQKQSEEHTEE